MNQVFSFDGLNYALALDRGFGPSLIHPNHPFHPLLAYFWFKIERLLGYQGLSVYSLERFNSLSVSLGLALFYYLGKSRFGMKNSLATAAFLGATYALWAAAVDGHAAGSSVIFFSLLLYQVLTLDADSNPRVQRIGYLAATSIAYTLSHGITVFHIFPLTVWIALRFKRSWAVSYFVGVAVGLTVLQLGFYQLLHPAFSISSFLVWVGGYATVDGLDRTFQNQFWTFNWKSLSASSWGGWHQSFLSTGYHASILVGWLSQILGVLFIAAVVVSAWISRSLLKQNKILVQSLLTWGLLVKFCGAFWGQGHILFHVHVLLPWTIALALLFSQTRLYFKCIGLSAFVLFVLNFSGAITNDAFIKNNTGYQLMREIRSRLRPGDTFLCGLGTTVENIDVLGPYFFGDIASGTLSGNLLARRENDLRPLADILMRRREQNRNVCFAEDLSDRATQEAIETTRYLKPGDVDSFLLHFPQNSSFVLSNGLKVTCTNSLK